jgi:hypothetical protein
MICKNKLKKSLTKCKLLEQYVKNIIPYLTIGYKNLLEKHFISYFGLIYKLLSPN